MSTQNSQDINENNFDDTELILQPSNIKNKVLFNYIKTLGFNLLRDTVNNKWRKLRGDNNGNLLVSNGAQPDVPPIVSSIQVTNVGFTSIVQRNPNRKQVLITWQGDTANAKMDSLTIGYSPNNATPFWTLPPGWYYLEDNYNGAIFGKAGANVIDLVVYEFF